MADDILNTIEVLATRVKAKEEEAKKLKHLVNELCGEAKIPLRYQIISESGSIADIRPDQFYGVPLTAAIRNYLELRKVSNLGAATVVEIFTAVRDGGYKFDTKNEDNARIGVGNALRKTSAIFHRLPNGRYGLLSWYPSARAPSDDGEPTRRKKLKKHMMRKHLKKHRVAKSVAGDENAVTNQEVRDVVFAQSGDFQKADIEKALKIAHPAKTIPANKIPTVLFLLKKKNLLKMVAERNGKSGATFQVKGNEAVGQRKQAASV